MTALNIPSQLLGKLGGNEAAALVEIACRLFQTGRLSLFEAGQMAGLDRTAMETALLDRGIALVRPTLNDLREDLKTIERWSK